MLFRITRDSARKAALSRFCEKTVDLEKCVARPALARRLPVSKQVEPGMSTIHFIRHAVFAALVSFAVVPAMAQQGPVGPFKDDLFSRMAVLESSDGGAYEVIDYSEMRDINGRDREPERRVKDVYVSLSVRRLQANETLNLGGRKLDVTRVGHESSAAFTVIFIHGRGGDRRLGANDYSFGGNFNRLKNLVAGSGGVYYSPSVRSFDERGASDIAALVRHAFEQSSGSPVVLACASMGGIICQHLSRDAETVRYLAGMAFLGGPPDTGLLTTPAVKSRMPIYFAHGSADSVYKASKQLEIYRQLRKSNHPTRFTMFQTGGHGTPIRMVDWRKLLNFMLVTRG
jgi:hypothetical protein